MSKRKRRLLVPEATQGFNHLKAEIMAKEGYKVDATSPLNVKFEVAKELDIPLKEGYNGTLISKQAGQVGGKIGGSMVKELMKRAKNNIQ